MINRNSEQRWKYKSLNDLWRCYYHQVLSENGSRRQINPILWSGMEGFENKDLETLSWKTCHSIDTHLHILCLKCPSACHSWCCNHKDSCVPSSDSIVYPHVGEIYGVFMLCSSRIRFTRTFTRIQALSIAHTCSHTCAARHRVLEIEVYTLRQLVNLASSFWEICLLNYYSISTYTFCLIFTRTKLITLFAENE